MIEFYDTHAHCIKNQQGGILIGLEGNPVFDGTLNNCDVERLTRENPNYVPAYYITKDFNAVPDETILKYHPRREGYSADEVIDDLLKRNCKLCIIDTLNYPNWQPLDYLKIVNIIICELLSKISKEEFEKFNKLTYKNYKNLNLNRTKRNTFVKNKEDEGSFISKSWFTR